MIAEIKSQSWCGVHRVILNDEIVAVFPTRIGALRLVNKLIAADFQRMDYATEGHANLWKKLR